MNELPIHGGIAQLPPGWAGLALIPMAFSVVCGNDRLIQISRKAMPGAGIRS